MSLHRSPRAVSPSRRQLELARVADAAGDPLEAIRRYTAGLPSADAKLDDFLNLAVLYVAIVDALDEVGVPYLDWPDIERWCTRHGTRETLDEIRRSIPPA